MSTALNLHEIIKNNQKLYLALNFYIELAEDSQKKALKAFFFLSLNINKGIRAWIQDEVCIQMGS